MNFVLQLHMLCLLVSMASASQQVFGFTQKPYAQTAVDSRNLLKYVANNGPYSDRRGHGLNRDPPPGCRVDQVVMLARHGERFPEPASWKAQLTAVEKIQNAKQASGSVEFAKSWLPIATANDSWLHQESLAGPYAGLVDAYYHGALARRRYGHLYDPDTKLPLFLSAYQRDADTGRKFGQGFLQWNYSAMAAVNLIPEHNGADSLSTHCVLKDPGTEKNTTDSNTSGFYSTTLCPPFDYYDEFTAAAKRLNHEAEGANLGPGDIKSLMDLVSYELNVRGSSPWAAVFTAEEWVAYEYFVTSQYYCKAGPGSVTAPIVGGLFLNATRQLFMEGPAVSQLPLAFAFAHETDILQVLATMGVDAPKDPRDWDPTQTRFNQRYTLADIVPQGARLVFERMACDPGLDEPAYVNENPGAFDRSQNNRAPHRNTTEQYVRVILNEAVVPIDGYATGPGKSTSLEDFSDWVTNVTQGNSYAERCQLDKDEPTELSFFWNYSLSSEQNADSSVLPSQATFLDSKGNPSAM